MLEGLEVAEVRLSNLEFTARLDAEHYRPQHLKAEALINSRGGTTLEKISNFLIGPFGSAFKVEKFTEDTTCRYIRGKDVKPMRLEENDNVYMPKEDFERLSKYALHPGDILVSVVGTLGNSALIDEIHLPAIFSCKSTALRIKDKSVDPRYLLTYLNSKYGRELLLRKERGAIQKGLNLDDLKSLLIFVGGDELRKNVAYIFEGSLLAQRRSTSKILEAENLLVSSMGLNNWTPPTPLSYVRSSSDVFGSLRLDAEHYQPRFASLLSLIDATGASARLGDCLLENKRGKQPNYIEDGLPVVNSKHVLRNDVRIDSDNRFASHAKDDLLIRTGDVLINGTGVGTIGRSAAYLHEGSAIPDNHVTILRPSKELDPIYLSMYLNSIAGQYQVEQRLRGSSGQIELYPNDIAEFRVWLAPKKLQQSIRQQVEQSFLEKQKATLLLDAAKRAVEIAIEDSEAAALAYLRKYL